MRNIGRRTLLSLLWTVSHWAGERCVEWSHGELARLVSPKSHCRRTCWGSQSTSNRFDWRCGKWKEQSKAPSASLGVARREEKSCSTSSCGRNWMRDNSIRQENEQKCAVERTHVFFCFHCACLFVEYLVHKRAFWWHGLRFLSFVWIYPTGFRDELIDFLTVYKTFALFCILNDVSDTPGSIFHVQSLWGDTPGCGRTLCRIWYWRPRTLRICFSSLFAAKTVFLHLCTLLTNLLLVLAPGEALEKFRLKSWWKSTRCQERKGFEIIEYSFG